MTTYSLTSAAPADLTKLVDDAVRDGEVVLTHDGHVVAKLVSTDATTADTVQRHKRVLGRLEGRIKMSPDFDAPLDEMRPYMEGASS